MFGGYMTDAPAFYLPIIDTPLGLPTSRRSHAHREHAPSGFENNEHLD